MKVGESSAWTCAFSPKRTPRSGFGVAYSSQKDCQDTQFPLSRDQRVARRVGEGAKWAGPGCRMKRGFVVG